ncbi:hypothetical protein K0504_16480 [Neiella marina]|uniref:Uncharacterized protein n=1 Tax=Neiella holothuriorum TaxID=2870530 RepID=A0ABS7EJW1_9GAMM|nr:hypothetical protein [Neiella holothuriorum]MBW8192636.1 hypothetical protein [Neiella holothuriorum]
MAYDFGSQTLGIKNPFKTEGLLKTIAGLLVMAGGLLPLLQVASTLKDDKVLGWTYTIVGFILLSAGAHRAGVGLFQLFRYFVGRSVPTSLAYNRAESERDSAQEEKRSLRYDDEQLHSMLMGRKNSTFIEPQGWLARLIHSVMPKLVFLPFQLRNLTQSLAGMAIKVVVGLIAFGIASFIVSTGLAGQIAQLVAMPILSLILLIYLLISWRSTAKAIGSYQSHRLLKSGGVSFGALLALAILAPVIGGVYLDEVFARDIDTLTKLTEMVPLFSAWTNLALLLVTIVVVLAVVMPLLFKRMSKVTPQTEVSEYRDNMQESIHPNEIFINIENIVLANRRYKEVPNRIYRAFDPKLNEQSEGKGSFAGELLIETQPALVNQDAYSKPMKSLVTLLSQVLFVVAAGVFYSLSLDVADFTNMMIWVSDVRMNEEILSQVVTEFNGLLFVLFAWITLCFGSSALRFASHLFWGEMSFNSLLMYLKAEGTYTESKISTGMSIHDSTRSENVVVQSSITPWIITSRINSTIFATSGGTNLESPRYIMGMNKNDDELGGIVDEIKSFLKNRESIANIANEKDLENTGKIYQVNEQMRAASQHSPQQNSLGVTDEEAAGYLRANPELVEKQTES